MDSVSREKTDADGLADLVGRNPDLAPLTFEAGSFRDRSARVFYHEGQVYRALSPSARDDWQLVRSQPFFQALVSSGRIVATTELADGERAALSLPADCAAVLRHERIPFITYPYEWCFSMLRDAALLHLELLRAAVPCNLILKDSSPYNVQFRGVDPVFIDLGSFERHDGGEPWFGYRQFCEMMLFPLLLQSLRQIDIQPVLRVRLDGISAREFLRPLSWRDRFRPGVLTHGWLQALLERQTAAPSDTAGALKMSGFDRSLIVRNLTSLTRLVERLRWTPDLTRWSDYRHAHPHVIRDVEAKSQFVESALGDARRRLVWDLGCNDGHFARLAARNAGTVLAMDQDHGCVERLFGELRRLGVRNVTPLCIDLLNPSPAIGWRGRERSRLETRGLPDVVLCLGLIHHLVIGGNIPMAEVVDWLSSLRAEVVVEFPSKQDPMVRALLKNKRDQYADYSLAALEAALTASGFRIARRAELPSGERTLLHAVRDSDPRS